MSWFSNLANSLREDDDEDDDEHDSPKQNANQHNDQSSLPEEEEDPSRGGVKEDLSELTKTLTRQLWGVASFLAPPPPPQSPSSRPSPPPPPPLPSDPGRIAGIRSDFAEIGGRFRNEISRFSSHKAVSEISKIASTFLPFGSEDQEEVGDYVGDAVGVTKEVLAFARNIAMHPETWLDFPLVDDDDSDDFDMSDVQQEHALAVERLSPRLAALRIELCPRHMSEGCFWKIYFVLLHPRLSKRDAELLSTPQIVEARALLTHDLQNRTKSQELYGKGIAYSNESSSLPEDHFSSLSNAPNETAILKTFACDTSNLTSTTDVETEKHAVVSTEMQIVDKSVVEEGPVPSKNKDILVGSSSKYLDEKYEDDGDDWLEDENSEMGGYSRTDVPLGNEEDVSFSDLEDDDDDSKVLPAGSKAVATKPSKDSQDWVQLNRNSADSRGTGRAVCDDSRNNDQSNKDTNDWLDVDTKDV